MRQILDLWTCVVYNSETKLHINKAQHGLTGQWVMIDVTKRFCLNNPSMYAINSGF